MRVTFISLLAANTVFASPLYKRQSEIVSEIVSTVTSAIESATAESTLSPTSVLSSAISSAQESDEAQPSASASSSGVPFDGALAFPCPEGQFLVYIEDQDNVQAPLEQVIASTGNFGNSSLFQTTGAGEGETNTVGQTRTVSIEGTDAQEVLTNYTVNGETGAVYLNWNGTQAVTINGLSVGAYSTEQQVYINDTETSDASPISTIKLFSNICASDYDTAQTFFGEFFASALTNGTTAAQEGASESASATESVISSVESAISSATQAVSSALSSATEEIESTLSSAIPSSTPSDPPVAAGALQIDSPAALVQCQPAALNFRGGQGPYFLSILPAGQTTAAPLLQFPEQAAAESYTWVVNIASGTAITLAIRDGTGAINYSDPITIQSSTDDSCLASPTA